MKRIFTYILVMSIAMIAVVSCSNEALEKDTPKGEFDVVTLRLCNIDPALQTKALTGNKIPGEDARNENTITHIDYFFFGDEAGTTLLYKGRLSLSELTAVQGQNYTYEKEFDVTNNFPDIKYGCYAYVVANYPSTISATTLDALMALPLTTDWTATQSSFVMDTYDSSTESAVHALTPSTPAQVKTFTLPLTRVAAKIVVNLKVAQSYTDKVGDEWTPVLDPINHQFLRFRKTATLAGTPAAYESDAAYGNTASVSNLTSNGTVTELGKTYHSFTVTNPYYTYPQTFDTGLNTSPYVKFQMQWVNEDKGSNNFYYKFLAPELTSFERNRIYMFNATIDVIGGTEDDFAEVIDVIYVADWWAPGTISATYESAKYLSVYNHSYTIYGDDSIIVPVVSSDDIQIISVTGTKTNLKTGNSVSITPTVTPNGKESFTLTHVLVNDVTNELYDCTPITYTVTIQHVAGGLSKQETVTIVQYPNIYVEKMQSNGSVWVNGQGYNSDYRISSGSTYSTPVFDNQEVSGTYYNGYLGNIGSVANPTSVNGSGDNNNQNNYNIYVSVLPEGSDYVIGDPRRSDSPVSNLGYATYSFTSGTAQGTSGVSYRHRRYFTSTTDDTVSSKYVPAGDNTQNVIAPAFKIASSYGKTTLMNYTYAKERCAAYQENGYPAGRWRLPTAAEIDFVISLSENNHIPTLFGTGPEYDGSSFDHYAAYWAGGGWAYCGKESVINGEKILDFSSDGTKTSDSGTSYTVTTPTGTGTTYYATYSGTQYSHFVYTRCVYDIWYWGDAPLTNSGASATAVTDANGNVTDYNYEATQWLGYKMD